MSDTIKDTTSQEQSKQTLTNTYMPRLLGYIRDRNIGFSEFIRAFDEYVCKSGAEIAYVCDTHNKPVQQITENSDLIYLERLVNQLGISLDYFPSNYNEQQLKLLYLIAIRGAVINRTGCATKVSIVQELSKMYPTATIEVNDGGINNYIGIMNIQVFIKNISATIDDAILSLYLKQNITGVQELFEFDVQGTGVFAPIDPQYLGQDADIKMEVSNGTQLESIFTKSGVKPYNYNESNPTGRGGYMFMDYNNDDAEEEAITDSKDVEENAINYLNTGFWLISLI